MGMIMHDDEPYGEGTSYTQGTGIVINNNVIAVDADNTPTAGSEKPVKSKGVFSALEANKEESASLLKSTVGWTGKNKFDNHQDFFVGFIDVINSKFVLQSNYYTGIVPVKPNTEYIITKQEGKTFRIALSTDKPANNVSFRYTEANHTGTEITVTTGANDNYLSILFWSSANGDSGTYQQMANTVMVRDASITDDTYEPYHESVEEEIEQIYADNGVLGAKNLLQNTATSKTNKGVTFTVNADKTITINGTQDGTGDGADIYINGDNVTGSRLKLSDYPSKFIYSADIDVPSTITIGIWFYDTSNTFIGLQSIPAGQSEVEIIPPDNAVYFLPYVRVNKSQTVTDITIGAMLRLASDPDDTYVPYAMTNREITEELTVQESAVTDIVSGAAIKSDLGNHLLKCGKVVYLTLSLDNVNITTSWTDVIFRIPEGYRPKYPHQIRTALPSDLRLQFNKSGTVLTDKALSNSGLFISTSWITV